MCLCVFEYVGILFKCFCLVEFSHHKEITFFKQLNSIILNLIILNLLKYIEKVMSNKETPAKYTNKYFTDFGQK